jgi:hypothetical protein
MGATAGKLLRAACLIACASLFGCTPTQEAKAPEPQAAAPRPAPEPQKPAEVQLIPAPAAAPQAAPEAKRSAPRRKARKPAPKPVLVVAKPPPPPAPPQPSPEEERKRILEAYIAAVGRSKVSFNPPSPITVGQSAAVTLSLSPPAETGQLAEELRKSLDAAGAAWTPRMRARLAGTDFGITPAEGKDFDGAKDLSMAGPSEWRWSVVPVAPGSKRLVATLLLGLPPGLSGPRDLPPLQRAVEVEATLSWRAERLWADYWQWIVGAIVAVAAIAWWAMRR